MGKDEAALGNGVELFGSSDFSVEI